MAKIRGWIARLLMGALLLFPVCPMVAQAQGAAKMDHLQMHGMTIGMTEGSRIAPQTAMDVCCSPVTTEKPIARPVDWHPEILSVCSMACVPSIDVQFAPQLARWAPSDLRPPDPKFETRSAAKRE